MVLFLRTSGFFWHRLDSLWLITIASQELSWFLVTYNNLPGEGGSEEGGMIVPFLPNSRKENENNKHIGTSRWSSSVRDKQLPVKWHNKIKDKARTKPEPGTWCSSLFVLHPLGLHQEFCNDTRVLLLGLISLSSSQLKAVTSLPPTAGPWINGFSA